jgi:hypothetical protein
MVRMFAYHKDNKKILMRALIGKNNIFIISKNKIWKQYYVMFVRMSSPQQNLDQEEKNVKNVKTKAEWLITKKTNPKIPNMLKDRKGMTENEKNSKEPVVMNCSILLRL